MVFRTLPLALLVLCATALPGCGGGNGAGAPPAPPGTPDLGETATVRLAPFRDPWSAAAPRLLDIANRPFDAFLSGAQPFDYAAAQVTLEYSRRPNAPYFTGRLVGSGLKPNFAYQLKLAGKPVSGSRGWGAAGDDLSNERIGFAGRWWDDSTQGNTGDGAYRDFYRTPPPAQRHSIYGYLFMGVVVTDSSGRADLTFRGDHSYHITWQDVQNGAKNVVAGTFALDATTPPFYGYGQAVPRREVKLWYEWETGRSHIVQLPAGEYNVRFLLTEEAFHTSGGVHGGVWQTVLASEDYPDTDASNDIRFTIGG